MGVTQDDAFEALGGDSDTGFFCHGAPLQIGGDMEGLSMGLRAKARRPGPNNPYIQTGIFGNSRDGPGIVGTTNRNYGVFGRFGAAPTPSFSVNAGVCGSAEKGFGVAGITNGQGAGVYGQDGDPPRNGAAAGVFGSSQRSWGVVGITSSLLAGVYGAGLADKSLGVLGYSNKSVGVSGYSGLYGIVGATSGPMGPDLVTAPAGVAGASATGSIGVKGIATQTPGAGIVGIGMNDANAGVFHGNVIVTGRILAGIKDAIVPFPDGSTRLLHCMESPEHWFEDFGSSRLTRGRATVKLDADFSKVVKLNGYRVFLTPEGDCQGLYVRRRGTSFEVHELQGGTSNVAFSYRIVAKRKDIKAHTRFAKIDATLSGVTEKPRTTRRQKAARLPSSIRQLLATLEKHALHIRNHTSKIRRKPRF
jgi:hypothetical protein